MTDFYSITLTVLAEEGKSRRSPLGLHNFPQLFVSEALLGPNIHPSISFSEICKFLCRAQGNELFLTF
jgi:hypothetical protein